MKEIAKKMHPKVVKGVRIHRRADMRELSKKEKYIRVDETVGYETT